MNRIIKFLKSSFVIAFTLTTFVFTFVPDNFFSHGFIPVDFNDDAIVACNKLLFLVSLVILTIAGKCIYKRWIQPSYNITGNGYKIVIEYGDIFEKEDCKKVISFDECYSTKVGYSPEDIKPESICGQFLMKYQEVDFDVIVRNSGVKSSRKHSECHKQECYDRGTLIPYNDYLLLAFAKLDVNGCGFLSREEYLQCLDKMWKEIDALYAMKSVAIPILGSGITRFNDETLSKQQLLDMIIASYRLSSHKLKHPAELHIVCKKDDQFSLSKIGEYV